MRIRRLSLGNPGQFRALANGIHELKVDHGPSYRVYYTLKGKTLILLLCGGDKATRRKNIALAAKIAECWEN